MRRAGQRSPAVQTPLRQPGDLPAGHADTRPMALRPGLTAGLPLSRMRGLQAPLGRPRGPENKRQESLTFRRRALPSAAAGPSGYRGDTARPESAYVQLKPRSKAAAVKSQALEKVRRFQSIFRETLEHIHYEANNCRDGHGGRQVRA